LVNFVKDIPEKRLVVLGNVPYVGVTHVFG
jgi:hypothetical protein